MTVRINVWSSPRNLSTAMMYSWRQRADTTVIDEPLYAHYLTQTGRLHPGNQEIIDSQNSDGAAVVEDVLLAEYDTPIVFFKQMAKHLVSLDRAFLSAGSNVLLIREPHDILSSLQVQLPDLTIADTGFVEMCSILDSVLDAGEAPIVVEVKSLLQDPERVLGALCARIGVAFDDAMLSWPKGPKPEDGVWAPHWYHRVWESTGWEPYADKDVQLSKAATAVLPEAEIAYRQLVPYQIGAAS